MARAMSLAKPKILDKGGTPGSLTPKSNDKIHSMSSYLGSPDGSVSPPKQSNSSEGGGVGCPWGKDPYPFLKARVGPIDTLEEPSEAELVGASAAVSAILRSRKRLRMGNRAIPQVLIRIIFWTLFSHRNSTVLGEFCWNLGLIFFRILLEFLTFYTWALLL